MSWFLRRPAPNQVSFFKIYVLIGCTPAYLWVVIQRRTCIYNVALSLFVSHICLLEGIIDAKVALCFGIRLFLRKQKRAKKFTSMCFHGLGSRTGRFHAHNTGRSTFRIGSFQRMFGMYMPTWIVHLALW